MRRLLLSISLLAAYVFTITSVYTSCRFWESRNEGGITTAAGLFSYSYRHDECLKLRNAKSDVRGLVKDDPATKAARVFGVIASILGLIACLLTVTGSCLLSFFTISKKTWRKLLAGSIWGAGVSQCFTFLVYVQVVEDERCGDDDVACGIGFGGICSLIALSIYFAAGIGVSILALQPPKENPGTTSLARLGTNLMKKCGISWRQDLLRNIRWQDIALVLYSFVIVGFSVWVLTGCRFYTVNYQNDTRQYEEGLIRYYYYPDDSCRLFETGSKESFTTQTKVGVALGFITVLSGGILLLFLLAMTLLFDFPDRAYKKLPLLALMATFFQPFVFLGNSERNDLLCAEYIEDQSCEMGRVAIVGMVNCFLYALFVPAVWWYSKNPNNQTTKGITEGGVEEVESPPAAEISPADEISPAAEISPSQVAAKMD